MSKRKCATYPLRYALTDVVKQLAVLVGSLQLHPIVLCQVRCERVRERVRSALPRRERRRCAADAPIHRVHPSTAPAFAPPMPTARLSRRHLTATSPPPQLYDALSNIEHRLAFATSEKLQLGSVVAAFAVAKATMSEAATATSGAVDATMD